MKRLFHIMTIVALFSTLSAADAQTEVPLRRKIKLGVPNVESPNMLPFNIAKSRGFFAAEGIEAEIIRVRSDVIVAALLSGNLDYGTPISLSIPTAVKGAPLKAIAAIANGFVSFLVAQSKYPAVRELRGRTIAMGSLRGLSFNHLKKILERNGLDVQRDVKVLAMGSTPARFQALITGGIDAAFLTMPYNIRAVNQEFIELESTADIRPQTLSWGVAVTDEKLKIQKDEVEGFLRALLKAMHFVKDNRAEAVRAMTAYSLKAEEAERGYEIMSQVFAFDGRIDIDGIYELIKEAHMDPAKVSLKQVADFTLLEETIKEMGFK